MTDQVSRPARVALVIPSLGLGGAERQTLWLAEALAGIGHDVSVITLGSSTPDHYEVPSGVTRVSLSQDPQAHTFPGKATRYVRHLFRLRNQLRVGDYGVALAMMPGAAVMTALAGRDTPTRVVVSERSAPWMQQIRRSMDIMRRLTYRHADAQVAQTQPIAQWLRTHTRSRNVHVVPNAVRNPVPSAPPTVNPSAHRSADRPLLLAAGTKPWQKGFDILIDAFAGIAHDVPEWDLAIVGLVPYRSERGLSAKDLMSLVRDRGLEDRVIFPGVVGNMTDWYAASELFVLSSRYEGFPNVLGEALAAGLPCVAFDCPTGPTDLLDGGRDGILVREMTSAALAEALGTAMSDGNLRQELRGRAGIAAARYRPDRVVSMWCEVLAIPSIAPRTV